jgi:hypothetical protein
MGGMVILFLAGCMDQAAFERRYAESSCELFADCEVMDLQGFATHQECEADATIIADPCTDYDAKAARACVAAIDAMECSALLLNSQPDVCGRVCTD